MRPSSRRPAQVPGEEFGDWPAGHAEGVAGTGRPALDAVPRLVALGDGTLTTAKRRAHPERSRPSSGSGCLRVSVEARSPGAAVCASVSKRGHQERLGGARSVPGGQGLGAWTLAVLGERIGCYAATVSRLERRSWVADLTLVHLAAAEVGVPRHILMTSLAPPATAAPAGTTVTASPRDAKEDPMRRRTLLTATAAAGPAALLTGLDEALAATPAPTSGQGPLDGRLATARELYDKGVHGRLLAVLPGLIADGHRAAASRHNLDQARLSSVYTLASSILSKVGAYDKARLTADRARTWAEVSGSPLAAAAAARELAIVLRHQDRHGEASA
ncbi:hypothetical protein [Streptomyces sp. AGS-58]|uniref:hypothetical protein n=1 Tax=unclassified Streptomyces TaxID=2593676 RepID=UPI0035A346D4